MSSRKPNIIFIQNDHQAYYRWGWDEGSARPMRPNFDALAKSGAAFDNVYCVSPLCGPARRTVLTGLFPHTHKQYHNYTDPPYDHEVYLNTLHEAGYNNYYIGKWHGGPGAAGDHNCKGFSYTAYSNPYTKPEYKEYLERYNLPQAVHRIHEAFIVPEIIAQGDWKGCEPGADYQCKDSWCGEHAVGVTTTPKDTHESFFLANLACEALEEIAKDDSGKPFSLRLDFWGPHQPHFPTQEYLDMYSDLQLPQYGNHDTDLKDKPDSYRREPNEPLSADAIIKYPSVLSWEKWNDIMRHCYAHITMVDEAGGRVLNKLKELGLDENTMIIWTTDHGDAVASHGGHFDKGSFLSEEVMRIPFAISWPGVIPAGQVRDELIGSCDWPVTMLDAAGTSFTKNKVHGRSLLPLVTGESTAWDDDIMSETYGHGYGVELDSRMIVSGDWKYVATKQDIHELYNLKDDPFELRNLIDDESYADILKDMRCRLTKWQKRTDDPVKVL